MYLSEVIPEMLEHYLDASIHMFHEDYDEDDEAREGSQKRSDVHRVIAAFRADANECATMMCDHEANWDEKKEHAEYWMAERKWAFEWLQAHWNGLWM